MLCFHGTAAVFANTNVMQTRYRVVPRTGGQIESPSAFQRLSPVLPQDMGDGDVDTNEPCHEKATFRLCENKGSDQLRSNCELRS